MRRIAPRLGIRPVQIQLHITNLLILASIASADTLSAMCGKCLNNSSCRIITYLETNVSTVQCACLQGWMGNCCQELVNLRLVYVTMTVVTLNFDVTSTDLQQNRSQASVNFHNKKQQIVGSLEQHSENASLTQPLTLEYWSSSRTDVCNIVPSLTQTNVTVMGLEPGTRYTFCARTNQSPLCFYHLVRDYHRETNVPNCIRVITKTDDKSVPIVYVILASCVALCGLIVLFIVTVIAKRNGYLSLLFCEKQRQSAIHRPVRRATETRFPLERSFESSDPDVLLLKSPRNDQTISVSTPQGPGIPKYQVIHKRLRGYASFTARNEQTIPLSTVLEYGGDYHESEEDDVDDVIDDVEYVHEGTEVEIHVGSGPAVTFTDLRSFSND